MTIFHHLVHSASAHNTWGRYRCRNSTQVPYNQRNGAISCYLLGALAGSWMESKGKNPSQTLGCGRQISQEVTEQNAHNVCHSRKHFIYIFLNKVLF